MMKKRTTGILAAVLAALLCINLAAAPGLLPEKVYADTQRQAIVNATSLNVRSGPGTEYASVKRLDYGTAVTVIGETRVQTMCFGIVSVLLPVHRRWKGMLHPLISNSRLRIHMTAVLRTI